MSYSDLVKEGWSKKVLKEDEGIAKFPLNVKSVRNIDNNV